MIKYLVLLVLLHISIFALPLQNLSNSFGEMEQEYIKKELSASSSPLYTLDTYSLKKGWNKLTTPKNGLNPIKTFNDASKIIYIVTYDKVSKLWVIMSHKEKNLNMLFLKYLEPNVTFFVLAKESIEIDIKSNILNTSCQVLVDNTKEYSSVLDSGISMKYTKSRDGLMSLQSRYYSHHDRGVYNDTRTLLIYPKIQSSQVKVLKYGPANPKVAIKFPKAYEEQKFYIYDFKQEKCFEGIFPSMKIPPFPTLKEIK